MYSLEIVPTGIHCILHTQLYETSGILLQQPKIMDSRSITDVLSQRGSRFTLIGLISMKSQSV
jgi:hypothetical protein